MARDTGHQKYFYINMKYYCVRESVLREHFHEPIPNSLLNKTLVSSTRLPLGKKILDVLLTPLVGPEGGASTLFVTLPVSLERVSCGA